MCTMNVCKGRFYPRLVPKLNHTVYMILQTHNPSLNNILNERIHNEKTRKEVGNNLFCQARTMSYS